MIKIQKEQKTHYDQVYEVVRTAFETAEHRDGTEHDLVNRLRGSEAFIPELSLAALDGEKVVGYILFTRIKLGDTRSVVLAPLAILPEYQRQGIGTMLIREGHRIAKSLAYEWSVVVGSERYYPREGYQPASQYGIYSPIEVPDINFMALHLQGRPEKLERTEISFAKEFFF